MLHILYMRKYTKIYKIYTHLLHEFIYKPQHISTIFKLLVSLNKFKKYIFIKCHPYSIRFEKTIGAEAIITLNCMKNRIINIQN